MATCSDFSASVVGTVEAVPSATAPRPDAEDETIGRILDGVRTAAFRFTLQRFTVDDVAKASGVSRATIYRRMPGGRDELIARLARREVDALLGALARSVDGVDDLAEVLAVGLMSASRMLAEHDLLQRLLDVEPEVVLPHLTVATDGVIDSVSSFLADHVEGDDPAEADYLARMFLSHITASGGWDLSNRDDVDQLVATQFLSTIPPRPKENT